MREVKKKKCRVCSNEFTPFTTMQMCCSAKCTNERQRRRNEFREERLKATGVKSKKDLYHLARITFNAYIRERDKGKPCICCGEPLGVNYQAGHYFSGGGHANVIFNEDNVHGQRFECNNNDAGNHVAYGVRLEKMIGKDAFEVLKSEAYEPKSYSREELLRVIEHYKKQMRSLKKI